MKKVFVNYGGILIFYLTIILCVVLINARFGYLNQNNNSNSTIYAFND